MARADRRSRDGVRRPDAADRLESGPEHDSVSPNAQTTVARSGGRRRPTRYPIMLTSVPKAQPMTSFLLTVGRGGCRRAPDDQVREHEQEPADAHRAGETTPKEA